MVMEGSGKFISTTLSNATPVPRRSDLHSGSVAADRLKNQARGVGWPVPMREVAALLEPVQPG